MKKITPTTYVFLALSAVLILDTCNVGHALFMLLLAGVVPGTSIIIGAQQMLEFFSLLLGFTLSRIVLTATRSYVSYIQSQDYEAHSSNGTILSAQS